jgi:hypothetical protein
MARPIDGEEIPWFELGIFNWFNFTEETIKEFSIDPKASTSSKGSENETSPTICGWHM